MAKITVLVERACFTNYLSEVWHALHGVGVWDDGDGVLELRVWKDVRARGRGSGELRTPGEESVYTGGARDVRAATRLAWDEWEKYKEGALASLPPVVLRDGTGGGGV